MEMVFEMVAFPSLIEILMLENVLPISLSDTCMRNSPVAESIVAPFGKPFPL